jgi:hypothetical protein
MKSPAVTVPLQAASCLCAALIAVVSSGCATPAVWRETAAAHWDPCPPTDVLLLPGTNRNGQLAFAFNQFSMRGTNGKTRPVLWPVGGSATNLIVGQAAVKAFLNHHPSAQHVPVFELNRPLPTDTETYATSDPSGLTLTLHAEGIPPGPYTLPGSDQKAGTAARTIGLPFAVVLDAALVATVVAIATLCAAGSSSFAPSF